MEEQIIYLNDYEVLIAERAIEKLFQSNGYTITGIENGSSIYLNDGFKVPIDKKIHGNMADGTPITVHLSESSSKEFNFHNNKFRLCISIAESANGHISRLASELKNLLKTTLPDFFTSLEHFCFQLGEATEIKICNLNENLLLSAEKAIKSFFENWEDLGKISSKMDKNITPHRLRFEIKENTYRYIQINEFTVYRKDNFLGAIGLMSPHNNPFQKPQYMCVVICKKTDSHIFEKMFDKKFEDMIYDDKELKGGKFTGDFKLIKLQNKLSLDDIVLEQGVYEKIRREIFNFFNLRPMYEKAGLPFKRGIALYGPTGTGKTMIAKIIACQMKETVIWVKAGDLENVDDINRIFRMARIGAPSVVIFEDIDFYAADRETPHGNKIGVATLMANLDGLEENQGILVIMTTNRIEVIEKAIIDRPGRIDMKIYIGELGKASIIKLLQKKLHNFKLDFEGFEELIPSTTVMSGSKVIEFSTEILHQALRRESNTDLVITRDDVLKALKEIQRRENIESRNSMGFK